MRDGPGIGPSSHGASVRLWGARLQGPGGGREPSLAVSLPASGPQGGGGGGAFEWRPLGWRGRAFVVLVSGRSVAVGVWERWIFRSRPFSSFPFIWRY